MGYNTIIMIKNIELFENLERDFIAKQKLSYKKSLKIFESMWHEAVALGVIPSVNLLEGIEVDIKIAKMLNSMP